jgi:hypothetical protein
MEAEQGRPVLGWRCTGERWGGCRLGTQGSAMEKMGAGMKPEIQGFPGRRAGVGAQLLGTSDGH